jgi:hypothetical protein
MTIGFSPFLTADVDETFGFGSQRSALVGDSERGDALSPRLELIRRRVVAGYYASPAMTTELARRLVKQELLRDS